MNGVKGCKLNRRQIKACRLGTLDENMGGLLMQAAYQVPRHVE
jgi:hypothetical protein